MAVPFASVFDLQSRWPQRPLSPDDQAHATVLLADASDMIREAFPDIDARLAAGTVQASTLARVVAGMVKRAMTNTEGYKQDSIDDYARVFNPEVSSGYLFLSANDRAAVGPGKRRRAFAVDLG